MPSAAQQSLIRCATSLCHLQSNLLIPNFYLSGNSWAIPSSNREIQPAILRVWRFKDLAIILVFSQCTNPFADIRPLGCGSTKCNFKNAQRTGSYACKNVFIPCCVMICKNAAARHFWLTSYSWHLVEVKPKMILLGPAGFRLGNKYSRRPCLSRKEIETSESLTFRHCYFHFLRIAHNAS